MTFIVTDFDYERYKFGLNRYKFGLLIKPTNDEEGAEWWVLAIIYNAQDVATLSGWLPDWELKRKEYKNKPNKQ